MRLVLVALRKSYLAIVANKDPVALWIQFGELLKALQLLLIQLDVQLSVQRLWVVLRRPACTHRRQRWAAECNTFAQIPHTL